MASEKAAGKLMSILNSGRTRGLLRSSSRDQREWWRSRCALPAPMTTLRLRTNSTGKSTPLHVALGVTMDNCSAGFSLFCQRYLRKVR